MKATVEHKYAIGDIVYTAAIAKDGIKISKHRITGIRLIHHCNHNAECPGWQFDEPGFEVSYTTINLGAICNMDDETIFSEDKIHITPEAALNHCVEAIRKSAEKSSIYTQFYKDNPDIHV